MSQFRKTCPSVEARRRFLTRTTAGAVTLGTAGGSLLAGAASLLAPNAAEAAVSETLPKPASLLQLDAMEPRRLHVYSLHTREELSVVYFTHGMYIDENIHSLNHLMRDRRANVSHPIDLNVYDQLFLLQRKFKSKYPIHILSGYRTAETNAKLRSRSSGVAKKSLHMEGRAADFYVPGVGIRKVQQAALDLKAGGVGLYSSSNFVHIDTGMVRNWGK